MAPEYRHGRPEGEAVVMLPSAIIESDTDRTSGRLIRNTGYLFAGQFIYKLTALALIALVAHYLSNEEFGRFSFAVAATLLFEAVGDLGVSTVVARDSAGDRARLRANTLAAVPTKTVLAVASTALAVGAAAVAGTAQLVEIAFYFGVAQALMAVTALARASFEGAERMEFEALSLVLEGAVRLLFGLYAVLSGFGVLGLAKSYVVASTVVLVATWLVTVHRFVPLAGPPVQWSRGLALALTGLPFAGFWLFQGLTLRADVVLLRPLAGDAMTAYFAAAGRLVEPTLVIPTILATAILPVVARHRLVRASVSELLGSSQKLLFVASTMVVVLFWVAGDEAVVLVFGDAFAPAVPALRVMALAIPALFAKQGLARVQFAMHRGRSLVIAQLLGGAVNVALLIALVPRLSVTGAAAAVTIGELVGVVIAAAALRDLWPPRVGIPLAKIAGLAAVGVIEAAVLSSTPMALRFAFVSLTMIAGYAVTRPLSRTEVAYVARNLPSVFETAISGRPEAP